MARSVRQGAGSQGEPDVVVTVVRGHAQEVSQVFTWGEESGRLSVGSRGDWSVSGPGVVSVHLWLSFDGQKLHAASGDATAHLQGRPLGEGWTPVPVGAELRFGFALLRVSHGTSHASSNRKKSPPTRLIMGVVLGVVAASALAAALSFTPAKGSPQPATAAAIPAPPSATTPPAAVDTPVAPPAPAQPLTEPLLVGSSLIATPTPPQVAEPFEQSPIFKPPAAYPQNVANRPIPRVGDKPWVISDEWRAHHERHLRAHGRATAKVVFLGDSITEGWSVAPAYRELFGKYSPLNLGIANDTTQNVLWRLEHGSLDGTHPKVVVLLIGINNLAGGFSAAQTADGVRAIVASIQAHAPTARVLVLAVFPARQEATNPLRQAIKDANRLLAGLANPGRVEFHDVGASLLEPDGSISKSTMRDFVHPTPQGFERVSRALSPILDALVGPAAE